MTGLTDEWTKGTIETAPLMKVWNVVLHFYLVLLCSVTFLLNGQKERFLSLFSFFLSFLTYIRTQWSEWMIEIAPLLWMQIYVYQVLINRIQITGKKRPGFGSGFVNREEKTSLAPDPNFLPQTRSATLRVWKYPMTLWCKKGKLFNASREKRKVLEARLMTFSILVIPTDK